MTNKKKVLFKNMVRIFFFQTQNYKELWWSEKEMINTRIEALTEIERLMKMHPKMERKDALRLLYQPNNITYNPSNFNLFIN
jgi:hypothetical protein